MAEATTTISVTPKQLGKHLRSIRRKKGLSLSEVARGAGLSRRELVNYERGKAAIPESDLWVLAGSCGVDVAELMPTTSTMELTAAASNTSVGDTVSQLRRGQEDAGITAYLHTLQKLQALPAGKRIPVKERELDEIATALGSTPRSIEQKLQEVLQVSPDEAERLRAMILVPPNGRGKPRALAAAPSVLAAAAALEAAPAPVPEPPVAPVPAVAPVAPVSTANPFDADVATPFAPVTPPEPVQAFPVAPAAFLVEPLDTPIEELQGNNIDVFEELARLPEPVPLGDPSAPLPDLLAPQDPFAAPLAGVPAIGPPEGAVELVDSTMPAASAGSTSWSAAEAPPIDVAMRQGSSTWDLGEPPLVAQATPAPDPTTWETDGWQPPAPAGAEAAAGGFWEGTDEWSAPQDAPADTIAAEPVVADAVDGPSAEPVVLGEDTWAGAAWDPEPWTPPEPAAADAADDVNPWSIEDWPKEPADRGAWDHRPDPAAVDTGFHVDWGTPETETPPGWDVFADPTAAAPTTAAPAADDVGPTDTSALFDDPGASPETDAPQWDTAPTWDPWSVHADAADTTDAIVDQADQAVQPVEPVEVEPFEVFEVVEVETDTLVTGTYDTNGFDTGTFETSTYDTGTFDHEGFTPLEDTEAGVPFEAAVEAPVEDPVEPVTEPVAELAPISWRADGSQPAEPEPEPEVASPSFAAVEADAVVDIESASEPVAFANEWAVDADAAPVGTTPTNGTTNGWADPTPAWSGPVETETVAETFETETVDTETFETETVDTEATEPSTRAPAWAAPAATAEPEPEPGPVVEEFVAAGPDWQLGNALPLVEVRGQGGLVMRRADERWALADVTTAPDFVAEVEVDFRSGPGLGVLFRSSIDDEGRMSGYSFDIDPIYDGGGYLVRQWQADRELWNPIARVSGDDPASMYGTLLVRLELTGEHLSAQVNGIEVLAVESLEQASSDRGRDGATGDRVGVQAWSSSDLVIDTVRVASR